VKHTIQQELYGVVAFMGVIWAVFFVGCVLPFDIKTLGVTPRTLVGLVGIPASPFLHASLQHLLSNTVPLFVLLTLLAGSKARSWEIVIDVVLLSGLLLWIFGRSATHIGASGLIFGLIAFLIVSGLLERRVVPLFVSAIVGFLYGSTLLSGVLPRMGSSVSWDGHLFGAIAGGIIAYVLTRGRGPDGTSDKSIRDTVGTAR
jgi:membrane associated rhomboid family serine protease